MTVSKFAALAGLREGSLAEVPFGALLLSIFACSGAVAMIATAHSKKMYDLALANVSGWVTQMPFVVMPLALLMIAIFGQTGVIPTLPGGGVLPMEITDQCGIGFLSQKLLDDRFIFLRFRRTS